MSLTRIAIINITGYIGAEVGHLWRSGRAGWIPYALLYEVTKSAGFASGRIGHRLPLTWRRALSLHRRHRDRPEAAR